MTYISRDPFARFSVVRRTEQAADTEGCGWCGCLNRHGMLFRYGVAYDDKHQVEWDKNLFCSIRCWRIYGRQKRNDENEW